MHKMLLAAASLATLAAAGAASAQTADWSGPYVGVVVGYADRSESKSESIGFDTNLDGTYGDTVNTAAGANAFSPGFCGGSYSTNAAAGGCKKDDKSDVELAVRAGYDMQFGNWVVGGVAEYGQLQLQDAVTGFSTTPAAYNFTRKLSEVYALRARGGYAFGDTLAYVTGGYAYGQIKHSFRTTNTANAFPVNGTGKGADGYQVGFGLEHKFTPNIVLGAEFLRTSLKDKDFGVRASNAGATPATNPFLLVNTAGTAFRRTDKDFTYNAFRMTASYRF